MKRTPIGIALSLVVAVIYLSAYWAAYVLGVSKIDLLKNLTTSIPSALSIIVAVNVALLNRPTQAIDFRVTSTRIDWKTIIDVAIVNLCAHPLFDFEVHSQISPLRIVHQPPKEIQPLTRDTLCVELGPDRAPLKAIEQLRFIAPSYFALVIRYRDSMSSRTQTRKLRIRNEGHIRFARIRLMARRLTSKCNA